MLKYIIIFFGAFLFFTDSYSQEYNEIYKFDWKKEKFVFGAGIATLGTAFVLDKNRDVLTPQEIMELDPMDLGDFRRKAINNYNLNSATISDRFRDGIFFVPLTIFLTTKGKKEWKSIASMYLETLLVNTSLTFISQSSVTKMRPFIYNSEIPIEDRAVKLAKSSFYSGHVSHVASLSMFTAKVLDDLYPESKYKWLWRVSSVALPAATAYWRYDAGKHFFADVMIGYVVGSAVGYLVPHLHKVRSDKFSLSFIPAGDSLMLSARIALY